VRRLGSCSKSSGKGAPKKRERSTLSILVDQFDKMWTEVQAIVTGKTEAIGTSMKIISLQGRVDSTQR
jgi:hypothetical protein